VNVSHNVVILAQIGLVRQYGLRTFLDNDAISNGWQDARMGKRIGPRRPRRLYLQEWREHRKLTQQQVADRLDTSSMTVSRWERQAGTHKPNTDVLAALAEAYQIEPQDFYHHPDTPSPEVLLRDQPQEVRDQAINLIRAIRRAS
jgi:transcriptional regulator with XRE-family HTH domain